MGSSMDQIEACGKADCSPTSRGVTLHQNNDTAPIQLLEADLGVKSLALQYLGRTVKMSNLTNDLESRVCGKIGSFTSEDIAFVDTKAFNIKKTIKSTFNTDAGAMAKTTLDSILSSKGIDPSAVAIINKNIDSLSAELGASYSKIGGENFELSAKTYFLELKQSVLDSFDTGEYGPRLQTCYNKLQELNGEKEKYGLINAITLVEYSFGTSAETVRTISSNLNANLSAFGISLDTSTFIKSTLTETSKTGVNKAFAGIVINRQPLKNIL
jgi:hypothetical protein